MFGEEYLHMSHAHAVVERESVPPLFPGQQTERVSVTVFHILSRDVPSNKAVALSATEPDTGFPLSLRIDAIIINLAWSAVWVMCEWIPGDCYILLEACICRAISHGKV